jgi:AraC-like DNA-binding protein
MEPQKEKIGVSLNKLGFKNALPEYTWDSRMYDGKDYDLWIILGGRGILRTPNGTFNLLAGDCLILRPWEKYYFKNNTQKIITTFYIHYDYIDSNMDVIPPDKTKPPLFYRHIEELALLKKWLEAILEEIDIQHQEDKLSSSKIERKYIFDTLCEEINKYPGDSYKVTELAKKNHYNYEYFSRLFKKYKGISPGEFIIRARINAAKRLLHLTNEPIGQIADILNYSDSYSFSKQFHKKTGATPSEYRKLVKKE